MKHAPHPVGERLQQGERVVQRVALVDDAAEPEFGGHFQVLPKERRLPLLNRLVIGGTGPGFLARQPVIVHAGFTECHNLGMPGQIPQSRPQVARRLHGIRWVPADDGEHVQELLRQPDRPLAALQIGPDANDLGNAGGLGPRNDLRQLVREVRIGQMSVRVVENRHRSPL